MSKQLYFITLAELQYTVLLMLAPVPCGGKFGLFNELMRPFSFGRVITSCPRKGMELVKLSKPNAHFPIWKFCLGILVYLSIQEIPFFSWKSLFGADKINLSISIPSEISGFFGQMVNNLEQNRPSEITFARVSHKLQFTNNQEVVVVINHGISRCSAIEKHSVKQSTRT